MKRLLFGLLALALALALAQPVFAQESEVITAETVQRLGPVAQIDFAGAPVEAGEIISGGFAMTGDGSKVAVRNRDNAVIVWSTDGTLLDVFSVTGADGLPDTVLDTAFNRSGTLLAAIVSDGADYSLAVRALDEGATSVLPFPNSPDVPLRVWFDASEPYLWLEVTPAEPGERGYVVRLPYILPGQHVTESALHAQPSAAESDPASFVRFGRIAPPLAVTANEDGQVNLWNLQSGRALAQARVDGFPVFGGLNGDATHLAWREPDYGELHLLDFRSGEDRLVTPLNGAYINYILVAPAADVILGVYVGDEPIIAAWDVATGERTDLGAYRACGRTPDMARLSRDGTTIVIGCDTGLDIWRVRPEN